MDVFVDVVAPGPAWMDLRRRLPACGVDSSLVLFQVVLVVVWWCGGGVRPGLLSADGFQRCAAACRAAPVLLFLPAHHPVHRTACAACTCRLLPPPHHRARRRARRAAHHACLPPAHLPPPRAAAARCHCRRLLLLPAAHRAPRRAACPAAPPAALHARAAHHRRRLPRAAFPCAMPCRTHRTATGHHRRPHRLPATRDLHLPRFSFFTAFPPATHPPLCCPATTTTCPRTTTCPWCPALPRVPAGGGQGVGGVVVARRGVALPRRPPTCCWQVRLVVFHCIGDGGGVPSPVVFSWCRCRVTSCSW